MNLVDGFSELIRTAVTRLPADVVRALRERHDAEASGSRSRSILSLLLENLEVASTEGLPVCHQTGLPYFFINYPTNFTQLEIERAVQQALRAAVKRGLLQSSVVDPLEAGAAEGAGDGFAILRWRQWTRKQLKIDLLLRDGGSANMSGQYALPDRQLKAGADLRGVARVILDSVRRAGGGGCPPGIVGVGIGGDRCASLELAEMQLLRRLDDQNPNPRLAHLEQEIADLCNRLGIGPMGFGGQTTVLSVKIGAMPRLRTSFFVSIAYNCWALRRATLAATGTRSRLKLRVTS